MQDARDAVTAEKPADVLAAKFWFVPDYTRLEFLMRYRTRPDERELTIQRFADAAEGYWNEQQDRTRGRLRRIWRLLR